MEIKIDGVSYTYNGIKGLCIQLLGFISGGLILAVTAFVIGIYAKVVVRAIQWGWGLIS